MVYAVHIYNDGVQRDQYTERRNHHYAEDKGGDQTVRSGIPSGERVSGQSADDDDEDDHAYRDERSAQESLHDSGIPDRCLKVSQNRVRGKFPVGAEVGRGLERNGSHDVKRRQIDQNDQ